MSPTRSNGSCLHEGAHLRRPRPRILRKCYSEPQLSPDAGRAHRSSDSGKAPCFVRFNTFDDGVCSSPLSRINEGYEKNSKVLITVTVGGSPGPIRIVVKLGTTVEDSIKHVIRRYDEEGRTPRLPKDAPSSFDLHVSYFSLQCLERSNAIGETGSRSFYLRKSNIKMTHGSPSSSSSSLKQLAKPSPPPMMLLFLPPIMTQKMSKIIRRMQKLFKLLDCLDSTWPIYIDTYLHTVIPVSSTSGAQLGSVFVLGTKCRQLYYPIKLSKLLAW